MKGYATPNSWGYRLVARLDYSNWVGGATFSPRIAFAHDVRGVSPTFNQGTQAITAGLGVGYRQNLQADVSYTTFRGGRVYSGTDPKPVPAGQPQTFASHANPFIDRDFFAITVSYSF
jgi:hypothetical protein